MREATIMKRPPLTREEKELLLIFVRAFAANLRKARS